MAEFRPHRAKLRGGYDFGTLLLDWDESGPDHDKTFRVRLNAGEIQTEGEGKSKKAAEQNAAKKCLKLLKSNG